MKPRAFIPKRSKNEIPKLRRRLTSIFNEYIRRRDALKGCISCTTGRVENAGHFYSTGSSPSPAMRFCEINVHGQCIHCNFTLAGNRSGYEKGLSRRYGKKILDELMVKNSVSQNPWTRFEYGMMIELYSQKLRELKSKAGV